MFDSLDELVAELRELGRQRDAARAKAFGLTAQMAPLIVQVYEGGMNITQISSITGISRPAVYTILQDNGAAPER